MGGGAKGERKEEGTDGDGDWAAICGGREEKRGNEKEKETRKLKNKGERREGEASN
jgi:hypothetical protein